MQLRRPILGGVKTSAEDNLSFETALEKLETLVSQMESGDVTLAEMIEKFEEGNKLLSVCAQRLQNAERKIELLKQNRKGVSFENLDPDAS